jgi:MucR family transcriptional regulator, transcriptional regulator of exopolysaccharide biosynthesis
MPDENKDRQRTAQIVAAYVRHHSLSGDQLGALISDVHQALGKLGTTPAPEVERTPAVSIRRSVQQDAVICIDCGWKGHMLRRHLARRHGLSPEQYRARWKLRPEHPLTAPAYSERRSALAKRLGLGRGGRGAKPAGSPAPAQTAVRSRSRQPRRSRSKAT